MLLCLLGIVILIVSPSRKVYEHTFQLRNADAGADGDRARHSGDARARPGEIQRS